jgi:hypothetical protein
MKRTTSERTDTGLFGSPYAAPAAAKIQTEPRKSGRSIFLQLENCDTARGKNAAAHALFVFPRGFIRGLLDTLKLQPTQTRIKPAFGDEIGMGAHFDNAPVLKR